MTHDDDDDGTPAVDALLTLLASHGDTLGVGALLVAVLGVFLKGLASGRIVFSSTLQAARTDKDAEMARTVAACDKLVDAHEGQVTEWRSAYRSSESARIEQAKTLDSLVTGMDTVLHLIRQLPSSESAPPREKL